MAFSYAWLAADADKDGDSVVVLEPATDSFEVAGSGVAAASGIDPVTTGKVEPFDATDEMGELGRAIPKSGDELLFGSLVALRSGSDGSEFVELGSAGAAEGKGTIFFPYIGAECLAWKHRCRETTSEVAQGIWLCIRASDEE